jgi:DNA-binding response OmpR family regulator
LAHILIVEDNGDTGWLLERACRTAGYTVEQAVSGQEALERLQRHPFDVMLLDLHLPDMHGTEILRHIHSSCPDLITIIVTAKPTQDSAIAAVKQGASDYLCKPVTIKEILEAIAAQLIKRAQRQERYLRLGLIGKELIGGNDDILSTFSTAEVAEKKSTATNLDLDRDKREVKITGEGNRHVTLTKSEAALMAVFLDKAGSVLSSQELAYEAWGDELDRSHAASIIRPLIFRLRQKLEKNPSVPRIIRTVRGVGYVFDPG